MTRSITIQGEPLAVELYELGAGHCPNEDRPEDTAAVIAKFWYQTE